MIPSGLVTDHVQCLPGSVNCRWGVRGGRRACFVHQIPSPGHFGSPRETRVSPPLASLNRRSSSSRWLHAASRCTWAGVCCPPAGWGTALTHGEHTPAGSHDRGKRKFGEIFENGERAGNVCLEGVDDEPDLRWASATLLTVPGRFSYQQGKQSGQHWHHANLALDC